MAAAVAMAAAAIAICLDRWNEETNEPERERETKHGNEQKITNNVYYSAIFARSLIPILLSLARTLSILYLCIVYAVRTHIGPDLSR